MQCWRRLLRVSWTARRSNQFILKEINPEYSSEGLMLKLKLQYFGLDAKNWLIGKDSDTGKDWRQEEKAKTENEMVGWHHQLDGDELSKLRELVMDREAWRDAVHGVQRVRHDWVTELNWSEMSRARWKSCQLWRFRGRRLLPVSAERLCGQWAGCPGAVWMNLTELHPQRHIEGALHPWTDHHRQYCVLPIAKVTQSCPTLCNPVDYTVHGTFQATILEWVAYPFSRDSSWPRNRTGDSCVADRVFTNWAIREAQLIWYKP